MTGSRQIEYEKHRGSKPAPQRRDRSDQRDTFVRLELTKEELVTYRKWREDVPTWLDILDRMVQDGYKFTIRWDDYSTSPAVFIFPSEDSDNRGFILSGRGGSVAKALSEALFKHSVLLEGDWSEGRGGAAVHDDPEW